MLHGVPRRPLGGHQVCDGAGGAQGGRGGVGVEVGLGGQVSSSSRGQVRMNRAMAGTIVRERVRGLSYRWSDVGLLSPVTPCAIGCDVLLGLEKDSNSDNRLQDSRCIFTASVVLGSLPATPGQPQESPVRSSQHPQHHHGLPWETGDSKGSLPSLGRPCRFIHSPKRPPKGQQSLSHNLLAQLPQRPNFGRSAPKNIFHESSHSHNSQLLSANCLQMKRGGADRSWE